MRVLVHNTHTDFVALYEQSAQFNLRAAYKFMRRVYPRVCFALGFFWFLFLVFYRPQLSAVMVVSATYVGVFLLASLHTWPILFALNYFGVKYQKRFGVPYTLELREDGVHIERENKPIFMPWPQLRDVRYNAHYLFFLNVRSSQNLVIPARSFTFRDEANSFSKTTLDLWLQSNTLRPPITSP